MSEMSEMSECTAAGVQVLNAFDSTMSAEDEELLLQQRILQSKALDDRRARQTAEEDLKFARHKIADRDKKLEEARARALAQISQISALQRQLEHQTNANAILTAQVHDVSTQMERMKTSHFSELQELRESLSASRQLTGSTNIMSGIVSPSDSNATGTTGSRQLTRQGSFSSYIHEKAKNMGMKRKFKVAAVYHQQSAQAMECALMEEADMHSMLTERCLARGVPPINDLLKAEMGIEVEAKEEEVKEGTEKRRNTLVSYDGLKRYGRGAMNVLNFNEPLDCKMPEDVFIDAKVGASSYRGEYSELRSSMHAIAKTLKKDSDNALNGLWFIFTEKDKGAKGCVLANPKEDFQKEVRAALAKTKSNLLDFVRTFNTNMKTILGSEGKIKREWLLEQRPIRHMEVQVDIPSPEDPRVAELQEEVFFLKGRQAAIYAEHSAKTADLEMHREKAEVNMQFLQQKVFNLHGAVHTALLSVYKHRFHWGPRCPNHFSPLTGQDKAASRKRQLDVGYNVLLGQAIDLEIKSLGQFADYFVSDQLFGVDLAAAFNPVSKEQELRDAAAGEGGLVMRKKEAVPMKKSKVDQARKLSTQLDTMLRDEKAITTSLTPTPTTSPTLLPTPAPTPTASPTLVPTPAPIATTSPTLLPTPAPTTTNTVTQGPSPPTTPTTPTAPTVAKTGLEGGGLQKGKENVASSSSISSVSAEVSDKYRVKSLTPSTAQQLTNGLSSGAIAQQPTSSRRSSVPSCATRGSSKRRTPNDSPNTHVDAVITKSAPNANQPPSISPTHVALLPNTLELGIDIGNAPPRGQPMGQPAGQPVTRFHNNRKTVGGYIAFAQ